MPLALTDQFQPKYESEWNRLAQQPTSRLAKAVSQRNGCQGDIVYRDQIRPIEAISLGAPTANRLQATPTSEIETEIRANIPEKFHIVKQFDEFDKAFLKAQSLPTSQVFMEMKGGFGRKIDDLIIAAATGTAKTGVGGATNTVLPAGSKLLIDVGAGVNPTASMNLEKVLGVVELLSKNEAFGQDVEEGGEEGYLVLGAAELKQLYLEARDLSHEFMDDIIDVYKGRVQHLLGLNVIRSERLANATNVTTCFGFVRSGIALDIWADPSFKLSIRDDLNEALQMRGKQAAAATRLEEVKVVEVPCADNKDYKGD